ncbi:MAG: phosphopantothenoylcysteine decarboxylase [Candidatus Omnitrophica bacterium]|nr:phosphopantothenoylcysteine decarboxylase [Candidatus Omnitrophota bacterium]
MKFLITAGPTREYLDPVRFISNPATGILGYFVAKKAIERGHLVTVVVGPCNFPEIKGVKKILVESALEMKSVVEEKFPSCDALIMTAAVSDWRPAKRYGEKLKIKKSWKLKLIPNPDILKRVAKIKKENQIVVGFALESTNIIENAKKKLTGKKLDMLVANTVENFGKSSKNAEILALYPDGKIKDCSGYSKQRLAFFIVSEIERHKSLKRK